MNHYHPLSGLGYRNYSSHFDLRNPLASLTERISNNPLFANLRRFAAYLREDSLVTPIILLMVISVTLGYFASILTEYHPEGRPVAAATQTYQLPKSKAHLPQCVTAVRAEYPRNYENVRYLERDGARIFMFHIVDRVGGGDHWVKCDADSGVLLR